MNCILLCFHLYALTTTETLGMKVNVEGTLTLGKEVINAISQLIGMTSINSRRSLVPLLEEDAIAGIVKSALICNKMESCQNLTSFLEEYVIIQARNIQTILETSLGSQFKPKVYEKQVEFYLEVINGIIILNIGNDVFDWVDKVKKICGKFQEMSSIFIKKNKDDPKSSKEKTDVNHKIILATVIIETKYLNTLCSDYNFCMKSYKVTDGVLQVLEALNTTSEEKVKMFIAVLYKSLFDTPFYTHVNEASGYQLQVILSNMSSSKDTSAKTIVSKILNIVKERLRYLESNQVEKVPHDERLTHSILSDMDHIYSHNTVTPGIFADFLNGFHDWLKSNVQINNSMHKLMSDVRKILSNVPNDIFIKLINEVNVLLDIVTSSQ